MSTIFDVAVMGGGGQVFKSRHSGVRRMGFPFYVFMMVLMHRANLRRAVRVSMSAVFRQNRCCNLPNCTRKCSMRRAFMALMLTAYLSMQLR